MNFYIGQKVVCVSDRFRNLAGNPCPIKVGRVYTVRSIEVCACGMVLLDVGVGGLASYCSCGVTSWGAWYIDHDKFRPVEDLTASLARTESERIVEERPDHVNVPQTA